MPEPDLGRVQAAAPSSDRDDGTADLYDEEKLSLEDQKAQAELADLLQARGERKKYADRLFWLVACWLAVIGAMVLFSGFAVFSFQLSDLVLSTLIGATTASVLGLFVIVANYLFPRR